MTRCLEWSRKPRFFEKPLRQILFITYSQGIRTQTKLCSCTFISANVQDDSLKIGYKHSHYFSDSDKKLLLGLQCFFVKHYSPSNKWSQYFVCFIICDALCNYLIPFVQFKTCEKHPWWSITFSKAATKSDTPPWVFFTFLEIAQMLPNRAVS